MDAGPPSQRFHARAGDRPRSDSHFSDGAETGAPALRFSGALRRDGAPLFAKTLFEASAGRWTAVLGRSGVGKTTLLKALAGLLDGPDLDGDATASDGRPIAGRVAWMAQSDLLPPWLAAIDAVALGPRLRGDRVAPETAAAALRQVGLAHRAEARPATLSGGERQRVALARTLLEDRPIALLDEPFSALDAATRSELQELAWERLAGRTVVIVTHDPLEAARLAHRAYLLGADGFSESRLDGAPLRAPTAPETIAAAAALTAELRATP